MQLGSSASVRRSRERRAAREQPAGSAMGPGLTYPEALEAIAERGRFGVRLGLGRTRALLRALGDPQLALRGALVGGTNGKGSVLALAGAVLRRAGYRVGETPKPHLVSYRERLQVDGRPIEPADFARLTGEVLAVAARVEARLGPPTEFELLTAMIFRWFAEVGVEVALVEVGLGGRLDATNTWDGGVAAITNVDLDHMDRLGNDVETIAREKAAIIKRGDLAVTGAADPAFGVIRRRASRLGVPLVRVPPPRIITLDRDGIVIDLPQLGSTRVGLRGRHQAANAAVADGVLDALAAADIATTPPAVRHAGYAEAVWPGRLELVTNGGREILLDGAHNPSGAAALAVALDDLRPFLAGGAAADPPPVTLVTASMADKDVAGVVAALAASRTLAGARVVCTSLDAPRALPAGELAATWRVIAPSVRVGIEGDPVAAIDRAMATGEGPVVIAGSLYLVGAARARLVPGARLDEPEDDRLR